MSITSYRHIFPANISLLVLLAFLSLPCNLFAQQAPAIEWQKCLGGTGGEDIDPIYQTIAQTTDGGYIIAGRTDSKDGDVSGIHGVNPDDIWVVKLSSSDSIEWQKCIGGSGSERADCIIQTSDKGFAIAGFTNSNDGDISGFLGGLADACVIKLDSSGNIQWQKCLGGSDFDFANSIIQTFDGGYAIAGYTESNQEGLSNHGRGDAYLVKLNSLGGIEWQRCFGGSNHDIAHSIVQSSDSGYVFAGDTYSIDGEVSGLHGDTLTSKRKTDVWVVKLSPSGVLQLQKCLGGSGNDIANSILRTSDGDYIIAGSTVSNDGDVTGNHGGHAWIVKLDPSFNILWQKRIGGSKSDNANSIIHTNDKGYAFVGTTISNDGDVSGKHGGSNDSSDVWVVKLDSSGVMQWQKCLGGTLEDEGFGICLTKDGGYAIDGRTESNDGDVSGIHTLDSIHFNLDIWVVKLKPVSSGVENTSAVQNNVATIYPNPSSDQVHLELLKANTIQQVECYDLLGRKLSLPNALEGNIVTIDVHELIPASYVARVTYITNDVAKTSSLMFIVQH
ncbi:MAG: T9SS type A sorting domain-containing protein [Candidatus Kapaibacterium sp.]